MKKKVYGRKFSRDHGSRKALFRSLIKAFVKHGAIVTTQAKAKAIRGEVDKLVNLSKVGDVASKRRVYARLANDRKTSSALFSLVKTNFSSRKGGYTRIINLPTRRGDSARMVRFEWVEEVGTRIRGSDESKSRKKQGSSEPEKKTKKKGKVSLAEKVKSKLSKKN
ncbi:50S ribosomal protein L17 [Patescibacteria group bacterium]|nr:50S ribosomal protein L17 [Patescibacteria group bacterium]